MYATGGVKGARWWPRDRHHNTPHFSRKMPPLPPTSITYSNADNAMMVCVDCGHPIAYIYKEYSRGNIRLSRCRKCR